MLTQAKRVGDRGEDAAARLLRTKGLDILACNWRAGRLELDVICADGDTLVFVEVKTRAAHSLQSPVEAMTPRKRQALFRAAQAWLAAHDAWNRPCRFDMVCVTHDGATLTLEHYPNAFALDELVDCSHAAWQPW